SAGGACHNGITASASANGTARLTLMMVYLPADRFVPITLRPAYKRPFESGDNTANRHPKAASMPGNPCVRPLETVIYPSFGLSFSLKARSNVTGSDHVPR